MLGERKKYSLAFCLLFELIEKLEMNGLTINGCIGHSGGSTCRGDHRRGSGRSNSWGCQDVLDKIACLAKDSLRGINPRSRDEKRTYC
jgi:hypothetical protein